MTTTRRGSRQYTPPSELRPPTAERNRSCFSVRFRSTISSTSTGTTGFAGCEPVRRPVAFAAARQARRWSRPMQTFDPGNVTLRVRVT